MFVTSHSIRGLVIARLCSSYHNPSVVAHDLEKLVFKLDPRMEPGMIMRKWIKF